MGPIGTNTGPGRTRRVPPRVIPQTRPGCLNRIRQQRPGSKNRIPQTRLRFQESGRWSRRFFREIPASRKLHPANPCGTPKPHASSIPQIAVRDCAFCGFSYLGKESVRKDWPRRECGQVRRLSSGTGRRTCSGVLQWNCSDADNGGESRGVG